MLDKRLQAVAALVRDGARIADIGTDHAYLPVELVRSGRCPSAIACDLREGPLATARRTVAEAGLSHAVDCRLGDGLRPLCSGEVDDIVIAGMGGETVAGILDACEWAKDPALRYIFQPMSRSEELRRYLLTNGYRIERETTVEQGGHWYVCMAAVWADAPIVTEESAYVIGGLDAVADREWLLWQRSMLQKRYNGMSQAGDAAECARLDPILKKLEELLV
ncbi:MAG: SAM-dependent methyltransferase [Clostridia bacterium]|nr:SAM-dependent methyltransferase [Clostridia bacterium]